MLLVKIKEGLGSSERRLKGLGLKRYFAVIDRDL